MSDAFLGFPEGGPSVSFRIDPNSVEWNFNIHTRVFHTLGGRVIQVLGGALTDLVIEGDIGESINARNDDGEYIGESWRLHENFMRQVREMMVYQSRDASIHRSYSSMMHEPARFTYGPKGWNFTVYIKDIADPAGGSVTHKVGRASHKYKLTLFVVEDSSSVINRVSSQAVNDYIDRISNGIGWRYSKFNGEGTENLDPYGEEWGEPIDLSQITDAETEGEVSGDGSVSEGTEGGGQVPGVDGEQPTNTPPAQTPPGND